MNVSKWRKIRFHLMAIPFCFLILIPFYSLVVNSLKDKAGAAQMDLSFPFKMHVENFSTVYREAHILRALNNSLIITGCAVVFIILFSSMTAYVIERRKSKTTNVLMGIVLLGMTVPVFMVPTYMIAKHLHLTDSLLAMIFVSIALNFPYAVFLYTGFFKTIPREIDESAIIDGTGPYVLFFKIIFPLLLPVTVTNVIIQFLAVWNDFGTAVYFLNTPEKQNLVMTTFLFFGAHAADWNLVFADLVFVSLPALIVYIVLRRFVISGLTTGAVKG
ncbi:carbohydrate ABC transporter permease [Paenibacillus nasutitermitis]|uniref:Sugar ABC transporter permease n=1 Tax=Paenibacillus nasutitermitis TaxID=1652958 RepID=A0A916YMN9_9BACL|nr:carbohydrate ABC transporter permease [Paenibacillus nasutitermitis]GGD50087.1 sugar ABC transporter permease [Paenibacillus nasutitermitis]